MHGYLRLLRGVEEGAFLYRGIFVLLVVAKPWIWRFIAFGVRVLFGDSPGAFTITPKSTQFWDY